jgi:hypothetical protein
MYFCPDDSTGAIVLTNGESHSGTNTVMNELFDYADYLVAEHGNKPMTTDFISSPEARPNPFRDRTTFSFTLNQRRDVELEIYDPTGRSVQRILLGALDPGSHLVSWDGRDTRGLATPAGVYFYQLNAHDQRAMGKVLRLR